MNLLRGSRARGLGLGTRPDRGAGWRCFGKASLMFEVGVDSSVCWSRVWCSGKLFLTIEGCRFYMAIVGWIRSEVGE
jgi:hypothetical protein